MNDNDKGPRSNPGSHPSETDRAWAAGFFDGEGNVTVIRRGKTRADGTEGAGRQVRVQIAHVRLEPLARFCRVVGVGTVTGPYPRKNPKHSPIHKWAAVSNIRFATIWNLLSPYLSEPKREQFHACWRELVEHYRRADVRRNDPRRLPPEPL